eukprot:jgi/Hompol1/3677/HPOL_006677-RA
MRQTSLDHHKPQSDPVPVQQPGTEPHSEQHDTRVVVSGCDIDGLPRSKTISASKFAKALGSTGVPVTNALFGWDVNDEDYRDPPPLLKNNSGFEDIVLRIDRTAMFRMPWNNNIAVYLGDFCDPASGSPIAACPRGLLKQILGRCAAASLLPMAGIEYEFYNLAETPASLHDKHGINLKPLTHGMFAYSQQRVHLNRNLFNDIFTQCAAAGVPLEALHTETGPGVYEAVLEYTDALALADRAHFAKTAIKQIALDHSSIATFMAKPFHDQPGCSGHIHLSLIHPITRKNLFMPESITDAPPSASSLSPSMRHFIAGVLNGIPSIMAILAPTINSYKRITGFSCAPLTNTYGFQTRFAAIRIIVPPLCPPEASRIEIRVPGADSNPYLVLTAIIACGLDGISQEMPLLAEACQGAQALNGELLPASLAEAVKLMDAKQSVARRVLGDPFIDHF